MKFPKTPREYMAEERDIFDEIVPSDNPDRDAIIDAFRHTYNDYMIGRYDVESWIPIMRDKLNKEYGKYAKLFRLWENNELSLTTYKQDGTSLSKRQDNPDIPHGANTYISNIDDNVNSVVMTTGLSASLIKQIIQDATDPMDIFMLEFEKFFVRRW